MAKIKNIFFLHFWIIYDYLMNYPSFFFSKDPQKVPKMTAKVQNFAQKMAIFRVKEGSKKCSSNFLAISCNFKEYMRKKIWAKKWAFWAFGLDLNPITHPVSHKMNYICKILGHILSVN